MIDENGTPRVTMVAGSTDPMGITELVKSMRASESYAKAFSGSGATGSGTTTGATGGSPGKGFSLTESEARNPATYRAAKEVAEKAGSSLQITPDL